MCSVGVGANIRNIMQALSMLQNKKNIIHNNRYSKNLKISFYVFTSEFTSFIITELQSLLLPP